MTVAMAPVGTQDDAGRKLKKPVGFPARVGSTPTSAPQTNDRAVQANTVRDFVRLDAKIQLWLSGPVPNANDQLQYYATPGPMTQLLDAHSDLLAGLPKDPAELVTVARRSITTAQSPAGERNDHQIRPAAAMLERIRELDPSPLVERRPAAKRFVGNCRHFATLTCALFRYQRIPARVRAGFAGYFTPGVWADHWILEYWRPADHQWVRVDPQWGDAWASRYHPGSTSESLASTMYWSGGEAWQRCRRGKLDPNRCNMGGNNWGIGGVRASVLYDLAALNKVEVLPWDVWGKMPAAYRSETDDAYDELLDSVSKVTSADELRRVREIYEHNEDLRVPSTIA